MSGSLAQLVEHRIEAPCVPSSSLGGATTEKALYHRHRAFSMTDIMSVTRTGISPKAASRSQVSCPNHIRRTNLWCSYCLGGATNKNVSYVLRMGLF